MFNQGINAARLNVTGITTLGFATAAALKVSGISTLGDTTVASAVVSGVSTLSGGVNAAQGGDLARLRVTGISTLGFTTAAALKVSGISTLGDATVASAVVSGVSTFNGNVSIADKIIHTGDTDTAIRFPAADTFTVETGGSERLRIKSDGKVGIGTDNPIQ